MAYNTSYKVAIKQTYRVEPHKTLVLEVEQREAQGSTSEWLSLYDPASEDKYEFYLRAADARLIIQTLKTMFDL